MNDKPRKRYKYICIILSFALFISVCMQVFNYMNYIEHKGNFINQMYCEINNCITFLSGFSDMERVQKHNIERVIESLSELDYITYHAKRFIDNDIHYSFMSGFNIVSIIIDEGFDSEYSTCESFMEDGVISNNEITFLKELKVNLIKIRDNMYSSEDDKGIGIKNMTIDEINTLLIEFDNKYDGLEGNIEVSN
ncbi:hypothetical protein [Abyssisolibacter fermentans]|uniref:hypothetical protein n=1 Tax=Abyssisolibacter fermentans TaxID=1766203 RepID=UPI00082FBF02|nr:hypothetical protein [Abyssisolibacter fermentans]